MTFRIGLAGALPEPMSISVATGWGADDCEVSFISFSFQAARSLPKRMKPMSSRRQVRDKD
jgi:hypothetical protein